MLTHRNTNNTSKTKRVPVPYSSKQGVISYLGSSTNDYQKVHATKKYFAANLYAEYEKK